MLISFSEQTLHAHTLTRENLTIFTAEESKTYLESIYHSQSRLKVKFTTSLACLRAAVDYFVVVETSRDFSVTKFVLMKRNAV